MIIFYHYNLMRGDRYGNKQRNSKQQQTVDGKGTEKLAHTGEWLMKIFILHLAYTILDGINNDYTQPFLGKFATVISVAVIILQVLTALCFIKLEPTDRRFRTTGVLTLILAVISVFSMVIV